MFYGVWQNRLFIHHNNEKALVSAVLTDIRNKAFFAQQSREALKERILAKKESANAEWANILKAELSAMYKRLAEF